MSLLEDIISCHHVNLNINNICFKFFLGSCVFMEDASLPYVYYINISAPGSQYRGVLSSQPTRGRSSPVPPGSTGVDDTWRERSCGVLSPLNHRFQRVTQSNLLLFPCEPFSSSLFKASPNHSASRNTLPTLKIFFSFSKVKFKLWRYHSYLPQNELKSWKSVGGRFENYNFESRLRSMSIRLECLDQKNFQKIENVDITKICGISTFTFENMWVKSFQMKSNRSVYILGKAVTRHEVTLNCYNVLNLDEAELKIAHLIDIHKWMKPFLPQEECVRHQEHQKQKSSRARFVSKHNAISLCFNELRSQLHGSFRDFLQFVLFFFLLQVWNKGVILLRPVQA